MYQFIISQSAFVFYLLLVIFTIVVFLIAYKLGGFLKNYKTTKTINKLEKEKNTFHKQSQQMWEDEKSTLLVVNKKMKEKLDDYRKKISGLGMLNFGGSKKRSDILYSLLMENELLEQILNDQNKKLAVEQKTNLDQRLLDINKRQRLLAEMFDDNKIKDYVQEILNKNLTQKKVEK